MMRIKLFSVAMLLSLSATPVAAKDVYFDVAARKAALQTEGMSEIRDHCLLADIKLSDSLAIEPITTLLPKKGYGSSREANDFMWHVMVLGSRALGGDEAASQTLQSMLIQWAQERAFLKSPEHHDPYYALKRIMMPVIVSFGIVENEMSDEDRALVSLWIESVVRPLDKKFGGHIDENNHRYLADATLMALGVLIDDEALIQQGIARYKEALGNATDEGELPMETRRGARAVSYLRHALTSLTAIASMDQERGGALYAHKEGEVSLDTLLSYFLHAAQSPMMVRSAAAENEIPGPEQDYFNSDLSFFDMRNHGHHYMAFSEIYIAQHKSYTVDRFIRFYRDELREDRPLIDAYAGGNTTCFFGEKVDAALHDFAERYSELNAKGAK